MQDEALSCSCACAAPATKDLLLLGALSSLLSEPCDACMAATLNYVSYLPFIGLGWDSTSHSDHTTDKTASVMPWAPVPTCCPGLQPPSRLQNLM